LTHHEAGEIVRRMLEAVGPVESFEVKDARFKAPQGNGSVLPRLG